MAIDVHAHLPTEKYLSSIGSDIVSALFKRIDKIRAHATSIEEMLADYREAGVTRAVIFGWDTETARGTPRVSNDYIAEVVDQHPDFFRGFASVDPHKGKQATRELERSVKELHLSGLKLHPIMQAFFPDDREFYPLYDKCAELGVPVAFHTGWEYLGVGFPGGKGIRMKYGRPLHIDDVAADFPDLKIIMLHPSWPWEDEQVAIVMQKDNVFADIASWMPKFYSETMKTYLRVRAFNSKIMFGSDYPFIDVVKWMNQFNELDLDHDIRKAILEDNAKRILGL